MFTALPLFAVLTLGLLGLIACLTLLHSTACVVRDETRVWDLRNEVELLHYDYQLQLHRLQATHGDERDEDIGMVDIVEEPIAAMAA